MRRPHAHVLHLPILLSIVPSSYYSTHATAKKEGMPVSGNADVAGNDPSDVLTERELVLKRLLAAHEAWFDVAKDYGYAGETFDGFAEFRSSGQKYVLSKKYELWRVNTFEYLFFKAVDRLTADDTEIIE